MSDTRKEYVPPTAEVILLAPDEKLAAWDWKFGSYTWGEGYISATGTTASAVGIINGAGIEGNPIFGEDGYTIIKK